MKYPRRSQYKHAKSQYRIRNWPEYEAGLKKRGDLAVWLSDDALDAWRAPAEGRPGAQRTYSDMAIEAALTIRMVFHLPLRQPRASFVAWQRCSKSIYRSPITLRCLGVCGGSVRKPEPCNHAP